MMNKFLRILIIPALAIFFSQYAFSQKVFSPGDYKRADSLADLFNKKVFHSVQKVNWVEGKPIFWYSTLTMNGKEFWTVNAEKLIKERIYLKQILCLSSFRT